ncbi:uncharacterized protein [Antedon mediterranea]|uniref:uncharacterized protein n=1 Tax=Antedon mediterranea TaxID=105859 RepID=UPI003AF7CC8C
MATECSKCDQSLSPEPMEDSASMSEEEQEVFFGPITAKERAIAAALVNAIAEEEETINNNIPDRKTDVDLHKNQSNILEFNFQAFQALGHSPSVCSSPEFSGIDSKPTVGSSPGFITLDLSSSSSIEDSSETE